MRHRSVQETSCSEQSSFLILLPWDLQESSAHGELDQEAPCSRVPTAREASLAFGARQAACFSLLLFQPGYIQLLLFSRACL